MIGLHVTTQGCKLNQFDSAELAGALGESARLVPDPAAAALIIVNTCTVTAAADSDARQAIRRRRRESPDALIVATGCYAERSPETLRSMPEVDLVLTRDQRPRAAEIILSRLRQMFPAEMADGCAERVTSESLPDFGERTRAYLRVQEGCDLRCAYCVIPVVRGASRSVGPEALQTRFMALLAAGYKEIVLTGVNTGDYGKDLDPASSLTDLLGRLSALPGEFRIRLNSVEPLCVTDALVEMIAAQPKIARHLQIPLQSGSDTTLGAMRRNYRTRHYARVLEKLRSSVPGIGLGADVIVGFPGETDQEFRRTADFIRSVPLNYLHVFSYSSRPGTAASEMPGHNEPGVVAGRSRTLRQIGQDLSASFRRSQSDVTHRALVLGGRRADGRRRALTSNFIDLSIDGELAENQFADVRITQVTRTGTIAAPAR